MSCAWLPTARSSSEPLLDISGRVLHHHERGLLGLALHPAYAENGRLFVAYSRREDGATSISQFTLPRDGSPEPGAVEATEKVLLTIPQPFTTHKAGMLAFDHDGMLVAAIGDGGSGNDPLGNGQDPASLLGALLRLDVDRGWPYAIPPDNGFAGDPAARSEVHAIGLRNPWRFSVDRLTGDLYIGDVGQGDWEEIDVLRTGTRRASFGWSEMEGRECFYGRPCDPADHILPAVAYPHVDGDIGHCSVIGGYAYRGSAGSLPDGTYLYADYCSGTIWGVPVEPVAGGRCAAGSGGTGAGRDGPGDVVRRGRRRRAVPGHGRRLRARHRRQRRARGTGLRPTRAISPGRPGAAGRRARSRCARPPLAAPLARCSAASSFRRRLRATPLPGAAGPWAGCRHCGSSRPRSHRRA